MRVKFKYSVESSFLPFFHYGEIDIIPNIDDIVNVPDIVTEEQLDMIDKKSNCWSCLWAEVTFKVLRKDEKGFYYEITLLCEDT